MHDIPEKTVIPLNNAVIRIDSAPLEYGISNETAIAANWMRSRRQPIRPSSMGRSSWLKRREWRTMRFRRDIIARDLRR